MPLVVSTSTSSAEQNSLAASTLLIAVEDPHPTRPNTMESILSYNPFPKTRRKRISRTTNKGTLSYIQARTIAHFLPVPNKHLTSSNWPLIISFLKSRGKHDNIPTIAIPYTQTTVDSTTTIEVYNNSRLRHKEDKTISSRPTAGNCKSDVWRTPILQLNRILPLETNPACPTTHNWGHSLSGIDSTETLWVLLQNPNGLKLKNAFKDFARSMQTSYTMGVGILPLTETNSNWNQLYQMKRVSKVTHDLWETAVLQTSQHPEMFRTQNQRGGTMQLLTDRWV